MDYKEAYNIMFNKGAHIRRKEWNKYKEENLYLFVSDHSENTYEAGGLTNRNVSVIYINILKFSTYIKWPPTIEDILAEDWEALPLEN